MLMFKSVEEQRDPVNDCVKLMGRCPIHDGCYVRWSKTAGFSNPFSKLKSCFGGLDQLYDAFWIAKSALKSGDANIKDVMRYTMVCTPRERAIHDYVQMIVEENWPLTCVRKTSYQDMVKHGINISYETISMVIFVLGEVVEEKMMKKMKGKKGILLHDGWTQDGTHFTAIYAAFVVDEGTVEQHVEINLLASSPMPHYEEGNNDDDEDTNHIEPLNAASFNAKTMKNYFDETLRHYGFGEATDFSVALLGDSTEVNRRLAKDMGIPHLPCHNHEFNLDIGEMKKDENSYLSKHIQEVRAIVAKVKGSIREVAILRRFTDLKPHLKNTCKWTGDYSTVNRFGELYPDLKAAAMEDDSRIAFDTTVKFKMTNDRVRKQLEGMSVIHGNLQKQGLRRDSGQQMMNAIHHEIDKHRGDRGHVWFQCPLQDKHSKLGNKHETDHDFCSGVIKIQEGHEAFLTDAEKQACKSLLKEAPEVIMIDDSDDAAVPDASSVDAAKDEVYSMSAVLAKAAAQREADKAVSAYRFLDFILSSAAIVESLWSKAEALLTTRRRGTNPVMVEALLMLKENRHYWSVPDVIEATRRVQVRLKDERLAKSTEKKLTEFLLHEATLAFEDCGLADN